MSAGMAEVAPVRLLSPAFVALTLSDLAYFAATGVLLAATPLFGSTVVVCRVVFAKFPDRVTPLGLAATALAASAAGFLIIGAVQHPVGLVAGAVVLAVGAAFLTPAVFAAVFQAVPATQRGSAAATTSVFIDLGLSGGPMALGLVAAATSLPAAFLLTAGLPVLGASLLTVAGSRQPAWR